MSNRIIKQINIENTIEFLGIWEKIYNPHFNYTEFGVIMSESSFNGTVSNARIDLVFAESDNFHIKFDSSYEMRNPENQSIIIAEFGYGQY